MRVEQALLAVKTRVVILSLIVAWALSFLTVPQTAWLDWIGFILLFWSMYQPARVTYWLAFGLGLFIDVQQELILGQHALMYVWLVFAMKQIGPRLQYSSVLVHALSATGIMLMAQLIRVFAYLIFTGKLVTLTSMVWIFLGVPAWLLLSWLIVRAAQSRTVGSWLAD